MSTASGTLVVRNIGELVTCDPRWGEPPGVVADAAVVAVDGTISYAGPEAELGRGQGGDVVELDAHGAAVVPGFVDAHTHAVWLGDRSGEYALRAAGASYEEVAAAGGGIRATVRSTAAGSLDELAAAARPRLRRMLAHGTTTVEIKSGYGLALDAEMRQLDAARALGREPDLPDVVTTYLPLHGPVEGPRDAFVESVVRDGLREASRRARFVDVFCDEQAWPVVDCRRVLEAAAAMGMAARVHADQRSDAGAARLAAAVGAASADHLEHAPEAALRALAAAGVVATLLPGASLVLGGPPPPGRRLLEAGAMVAVATDCNPGTCYSESMPLMVSLAVALAGLTPVQALVAATAGGAASLRLHDRGAIRPGLRCDLVVLASPRWLEVAYHLGAVVVERVIRAGKQVWPGPPV